MTGSFARFLRACALTLAWQLPRARGVSSPCGEGVPLSLEARRESRKRERRQAPKQRVRPPPRHLPGRGGYQGTKARDWRFSQQRALRRMFRNC